VNHFSTAFRTGPEAASIDHFSIFVEGAVMAPDISKVDTDRHLNPRSSALNFRDEVLRRVFHGNSLSPFRKTCSSHFSVLTTGGRRARKRALHLRPGCHHRELSFFGTEGVI
jgi:hypothetical protein